MDIEALLETLAEIGATESADALRELDAEDPITALVLEIVADAIERDGADGLIAVKDLIASKVNGSGSIDHDMLRMLPLRQRSDLIAAYERDEDDTIDKVNVVMSVVVDVLAKISASVVRAMIE